MSQVDSEERKNKAMKRILIVLLAIFCILPLAACSKRGNGGTTTNNGMEGSDTGDSGSPVPDNLDYDNLVINIGVRNREDIAFEMDPEQNSVDKMVAAIESRNLYVQNRLNVSMKLIPLPGMWTQKSEFITAVRQNAESGSEAMDILFGPNYSMVPLMLDGMFLNYYNTKYVDLESPYWNSSFINECTYDGKLYLLEGDLTLSMLDSAFVMFCDTANFRDRTDGDDLYRVVREKKWTFEKLKEYVTLFGTENRDGDDSRDTKEDFFGMVSPAFSSGRDGFPTAFGVTVVSKDANGKITTTFAGEKKERYVNIYADFYRFVNDNEGVFVNGNNDGAREECREMFTTGNTVFITELLNYAGKLRSQERDYGIFPLPMYDESQSDYSTLSEAVHSQIAIMAGSEKAEAVSALLEELGYQTRATVMDVYYETVKYRNNRLPESVEMLNIILNSVTATFGSEFADELRSPFPTPIGSSESVSDLSAQKDAITYLMNKLKRKIQALE